MAGGDAEQHTHSEGSNRLLARGSEQTAVWDVTDPAGPVRRAALSHGRHVPRARVEAVAFSPDGRLLAACGRDIWLWDTLTPAQAPCLPRS